MRQVPSKPSRAEKAEQTEPTEQTRAYTGKTLLERPKEAPARAVMTIAARPEEGRARRHAGPVSCGVQRGAASQMKGKGTTEGALKAGCIGALTSMPHSTTAARWLVTRFAPWPADAGADRLPRAARHLVVWLRCNSEGLHTTTCS